MNLDFGALALGTSADRVLTVTNSGSGMLVGSLVVPRRSSWSGPRPTASLPAKARS